jgi:hypothetical protein
VRRLRKLLPPAVLALLLAAPANAGATTSGTISFPERGHLIVHLHQLGGDRYGWSSLRYQLYHCHAGAPQGADCRWMLWGRISPSYDGCPKHETIDPNRVVRTIFRHRGTIGEPSLNLGGGEFELPAEWRFGRRQFVCWYAQTYDGISMSLTAETVITH